MVQEQRMDVQYGRKAYGAHRVMSAQQKARNVAQSIATKIDHDNSWSWTQYGLEHNPAQQALVLQALAALR